MVCTKAYGNLLSTVTNVTTDRRDPMSNVSFRHEAAEVCLTEVLRHAEIKNSTPKFFGRTDLTKWTSSAQPQRSKIWGSVQGRDRVAWTKCPRSSVETVQKSGKIKGARKCEVGVDVVGVVTPLVRGVAQVLHGEQVVELSVQLEERFNLARQHSERFSGYNENWVRHIHDETNSLQCMIFFLPKSSEHPSLVLVSAPWSRSTIDDSHSHNFGIAESLRGASHTSPTLILPLQIETYQLMDARMRMSQQSDNSKMLATNEHTNTDQIGLRVSAWTKTQSPQFWSD